MTTIYSVDPLRDPRWAQFVEKHPRASVFHTPGWLEALRRTYAYQPVALTTSAPDQALDNGLVFCRIDSFLTGRRLVSLPFADHCEPLFENPDDLIPVLGHLQQGLREAKWKYIELRPRTWSWEAYEASQAFYLHTLDLSPEIGQLLRSFHKDSVQRKIRRTEREGLIYEEGRSAELLDKFYRLLLLTRRRHGLPPQPRDWFRNLMASLGESFKVRVASKEGQPIASIITLRHRDVLVYKYGCSDPRFHKLGGVALLFWKAIQEAKQDGLNEFDLGRSDHDNPGLVTFKEHWGAARSTLAYFRCPARARQTIDERYAPLARRLFARMPDGLLTLAGRLLYRHIG